MAQNLVFQSIFLVFLAFFSFGVAGEPVEDKQALLEFISGVPHSSKINWSPNTTVCGDWIGVSCSLDQSRVVAVRLPGSGLIGPIPENTIGRLSGLRILSLRLNALSAPIPGDFVKLTLLTELHLQSNAFTGPFPVEFSSLSNLVVLNLSYNKFNGSIPASIANITKLTTLNLANNSFSGPIPELDLPNLQSLNLANNRLNGSVPESLRRFPNSSFSGNDLSTFVPLVPSGSPPPLPPSPSLVPSSRTATSFSKSAILGIVVGGGVVLFIVVALFMYVFCARREEEIFVSGKLLKGDRSPGKTVTGKPGEHNRLVFFEGCNYAFDLEDLLTASAEVLGKGTFGTAYKAVLEDVITVVVKRLKEVGVGKKEFEQQMEVVGRIKHENVAELRAYYYSKDEKLMVYDYFSQGSVCALLHGNKGDSRTPLNWEARLKIALGAARGIARIHSENNGKLVHGNIKSSNIFLNSQQYGVVCDLGLTSLMNPMVPPLSRTAGYRAPEMVDTRKASQAADTYSFGVLMLELLTGKSPIQILGGGDEVIHLVRWVQSVVHEEWTAEVFDLELMKYPNIEEELVEVLHIALSCVTKMPEKRPKMEEVVRMIECVRSLDSENQSSSEDRPESSMQRLV